jgi:Zn-dependent protease
MLVADQPTPYDWNFRLFGVAVRVSPWFWLVSAFLGWDFVKDGLHFLLLWMACVFVSILWHELGHVWMGNLFGTRGHIVLSSFCGLAIGASALDNRWQRIAVSAAGPGIQLLLAAVLYAGWRGGWLIPDDAGLAWRVVIWSLLWINLVWPILNLFPIHPLDGGQIARELFTWAAPENGLRWSLVLSMVAAGLVAVACAYLFERSYTLILFLLLGLNNWVELQQVIQRGGRWGGGWDDEPRQPWEQDPDFWKR